MFRPPKEDNIMHIGAGRDKWYQSHALAKSMGLIYEDACARRGVDCSDPKGGLAFHRIPHCLGKYMGMCL